MSEELDDLRQLIALMEEERLLELEVEEDGQWILLRSDAAVAASAREGAVIPVVPAQQAPAPAALPEEEEMPENCKAIRSPMTGVFYRAPSPDAPPFVRDGDAVEVGDVLGLVEAMKVFNEITAEEPGCIAKVLVENQQDVKVDDVLFWLETTA